MRCYKIRIGNVLNARLANYTVTTHNGAFVNGRTVWVSVLIGPDCAPGATTSWEGSETERITSHLLPPREQDSVGCESLCLSVEVGAGM